MLKRILRCFELISSLKINLAKIMVVWDLVVQSFERKLSMWKRSHLSLGGRITLMKEVLSNLSVYYMSLLLLPTVVRNKLDRIVLSMGRLW